MSQPTPDPQQTRKVLWMANLTAVMMFAALILFLPRLMEPLDLPDVQIPLFIVGLLSLPLAFLAGRIMGLNKAPEPTASPQKPNPNTVSRFAVAGSLAELPAMFGLVFALVGGDSFYGLMLASASLIAMMLLKPE